MNAITLENISKRYNSVHHRNVWALKDISLEIKTGEFFIFVGPSGCGKSTLLRIASGLDKDHTGKVTYHKDIHPHDISFVFQQFALLPWLTVEQNISLNLIGRKYPKQEMEKIVQRELERFHLEKFAKSYPRELSGGMRQRVGIARALASNPKVLFMDEPFSELDTFTAEELRNELLGIWENSDITIVMVTHLVPEALQLGDRIAILSSRPGKLVELMENTLKRPRNKRSAEFFKLEDHVTGLLQTV